MPKKITGPNAIARERLKPIVEAMSKHPELVDIDTWANKVSTKSGSFCGTTGCIAGYVNAAYGFPKRFQEQFVDSDKVLGKFAETAVLSKRVRALINQNSLEGAVTPGDIAAKLLEFDEGFIGSTLFLRSLWPEPFRSRYVRQYHRTPDSFRGMTKEQRTALGKIVIARAKYFIRTGV